MPVRPPRAPPRPLPPSSRDDPAYSYHRLSDHSRHHLSTRARQHVQPRSILRPLTQLVAHTALHRLVRGEKQGGALMGRTDHDAKS
eukprot:COSAG01_NODE_4833_length_4702_cov_1396.540083_5_plen_86_part_00